MVTILSLLVVLFPFSGKKVKFTETSIRCNGTHLFERLRQDNHESQAKLGYIVSLPESAIIRLGM